MFYRDTIVAGRTVMRSLRASSRMNTDSKKRKPKQNPTSAAVQKVNFRNAVKILTAKLNYNFKPGDHHLVLTYSSVVTPAEAKKQLDKFQRNLRNYCKRNNIDFKWVAVTEYKHTRIHHHLVMNDIDTEVIQRYWKCGYIRSTALDESGNYYKLAEYLLKETEKTFREENSPQKKRYSSSRNVVMPEVKRERISGREVRETIKALKGYYVDEETVRRYEHAILKVDCMEYIMVSLEKEPRLKRWPKGKAVSPRESYKDYEQQLSFEELYIDVEVSCG